ncbi:MAG: hypothetical protein JXQ23_12965 [Clostridia bacterium]|nr:hypothetical protein [Clostridia bacterium]
MIKLIHFKSDLKHIFREKIILLLFLIPLMIPVLFRLMTELLVPFLNRYITFSILPYQSYILSATLLMTPFSLGVVMGFVMLDDKDGKISELMSITPNGRLGYIVNRMMMIAVFTFIYTCFSYYVLHIYLISLLTLLYISFLLCFYGSTLGLILFTIASDKVKGLTYAKGLNILLLFAFADLLHSRWLTYLAYLFPPYWITKIIEQPTNFIYVISGLITILCWFLFFAGITDKKVAF